MTSTIVRYIENSDWRVKAAGIVLIALALRLWFFVGFGLGDDVLYIDDVRQVLSGHYPPLDPLNQYAYRPLLLYLLAGGVALFGYTDFGIVAPVLTASLATTVLVIVFVRTLIDPRAAWWCGLLFACLPFDVVNSTTMTNDVILSCLLFCAVWLFLLADAQAGAGKSTGLFLAAGAVMTAAFLVKITVLPVLLVMMAYSLVRGFGGSAQIPRRHPAFYASFGLGVASICLAYYLKTGDFLWQFKSELTYYDTFKPDWYVAGNIDYLSLMSQYPRSLFWRSGPEGFKYFEHGFLFWWFVPSAVWVAGRHGKSEIRFLIASTLVIFVFFEVYPQYVFPHYLPLVRQERYLEMLLPGTIVVAGVALYELSRRRRTVAIIILGVLAGDSLVEASRRSLHYADSQSDMRELARYAASTVVPAHKPLAVDEPANRSMAFLLKGTPIALHSASPAALVDLQDEYVAMGGARSFWWSRESVLDVSPHSLPENWILAYEHPAAKRPWRPSTLRVYYVTAPSVDISRSFDEAMSQPPGIVEPGLLQTNYPAGFAEPGMRKGFVDKIPDIDHGALAARVHLEWTGWIWTEDGLYTFETDSDDGSWIYLNEKLLLDNGGTHPVRSARRTIRLDRGWYGFRFRYENTIADSFLRFRIFKNFAALDPTRGGLFVRPRANTSP